MYSLLVWWRCSPVAYTRPLIAHLRWCIFFASHSQLWTHLVRTSVSIQVIGEVFIRCSYDQFGIIRGSYQGLAPMSPVLAAPKPFAVYTDPLPILQLPEDPPVPM